MTACPARLKQIRARVIVVGLEVPADHVIDIAILIVVEPIDVGSSQSAVVIQVFGLIDPELIKQVRMLQVGATVQQGHNDAASCNVTSGTPPHFRRVDMLYAPGSVPVSGRRTRRPATPPRTPAGWWRPP